MQLRSLPGYTHQIASISIALFLIAILVALLFVSVPLHAITPAGTRIENRAMATYPWEGDIRTTWSDWVSIPVRQIAGVEIRPVSLGLDPSDPSFEPASRHAAVPGGRVHIPYRLHNLGNGTDTFRLDVVMWNEADGDLYPLHDVAIYHDSNENGRIDPFEPVVEWLTLVRSEDVSLILTFRVPDLAQPGDTYFVSVIADSEWDPTVRSKPTWSATRVLTAEPILTVHRVVDIVAGTWPNAPVPQPGLAAGQGATLRHTITVQNASDLPATHVTVLEPVDLSEQLIDGADGSILYINGVPVSVGSGPDGGVRLVTQADGTLALEITFDQLLPREQVVLVYETLVDWYDDRQAIRKVAQAVHGADPGDLNRVISNEIVVHRELHYSIEMFPSGLPPYAGETPIHRRLRAYAGESAVFATTVRNTGTMAGYIEITQTAPVPPGWSVGIFTQDGVTPFPMGSMPGWVDLGLFLPGAEREILLVIEIPDDETLYGEDSYLFELEAAFQVRPDANATLPVKIERVYPIEYLWDPLRLGVDLNGVAIPGIELTYTLEFGNASELDMQNVTVVTHLSPHLDFLEITGVLIGVVSVDPPVEAANAVVPMDVPEVKSLFYDPEQHALVWEITHLVSRAVGEISFRSRVRESVTAGTVIEVLGTLASDVTTVVAVSNVVTNVVLPSEMIVTITADYPLVTLGDINGYYVDIVNINPLSDLANVELVIQLPRGLTYREGTSVLDGKRIADPVIEAGVLRYRIPHIPSEGASRLAFDTVVNAHADYELTVSAQASVRRPTGQTTSSQVARVRTFVMKGIFSDEGLIVGRITSRDGAPVADVRVILDNGRYSVSDADGFYSFVGVAPGPRLLRLDPTTQRGMVPIDSDPANPNPVTRVIVPQSGMATANFVLLPTVVEVTTFDSRFEGESL